MWYRLDDTNNVIACTMQEASVAPKKHVADERYLNHKISTVFLRFDYQDDEGPPLVFETMIFPDSTWDEIYCERYSTWGEAAVGHAKAKEWLVEYCRRNEDTITKCENES